MRKTRRMMLLLASAVILSSCTNTYYVTSKKTFDDEVASVKSDMAKKGYSLSGSNTETKNNVYVEGTSYSRYTGYGSKMANDFITTDKYRFSDESGNTVDFSVSYKAKQDASTGLVYVTEVSTAGCETSNAKLYDEMCGSNSPIKKIDALPQDASIEVTDVMATTLLVTGLSVVGSLLLCLMIL